MTLDSRLEALEDKNLTPKEAVICWMREAHQFDSILDYGRWLLDQPDAAYPLIRMPSQVVAAVRSRNKGKKDDELRDQFYQAQKDVLFLYQIHKQLNMRAIAQEEARRLKAQMLKEKLKGLTHRTYLLAMARLGGFDFPEDMSVPLAERAKTKDELSLDEEALSWHREEMLLWSEVMSFTEAARLLSQRYLGGEELLYPVTRRSLEVTLALLEGMRESYRRVLEMRPPDSDEDFARWLAGDGSGKDRGTLVDEVADDMPRLRVKRAAQAIARHVVLVARAEALDDLGERDESIRLVQDWMRSEEGLQRLEDASGAGRD